MHTELLLLLLFAASTSWRCLFFIVITDRRRRQQCAKRWPKRTEKTILVAQQCSMRIFITDSPKRNDTISLAPLSSSSSWPLVAVTVAAQQQCIAYNNGVPSSSSSSSLQRGKQRVALRWLFIISTRGTHSLNFSVLLLSPPTHSFKYLNPFLI